MSQTFYSSEDVNVVNSIGKFLATITKVRDSFSKLTNDFSETLRIIDFNKNLYDLVNKFKKKNKLLDYLKSLSFDDQRVTKEGVELINEILEGSASFLIKSNEKELSAVFQVGKQVDWEKLIPELHLSKLSKQRVSIVRDLFSYELSVKMKSALIIFLKQGNEEMFLTVFRETTEFEINDEEISEKVADTLMMFDLSFHTESPASKADDVRQFEVNDSDCHNLLTLLQEFKQKLNILLDTNSSSVYLVNQKSQNIWTKSSNSSKALIYPISADSILGYSYINKQIVLLPDYSHRFSDIKLYQDKYIVCLPICEMTFTHPVIALVLVTRSTQFSNSEIMTLNKFSETLANILYMNYLEIVKKWKVKHSSSLNTSRNRVNEDLLKRKRASIMSVSLVQLSTETILENLLKCEEVKFFDKEETSDLDDVNSALKTSRESGKYIYIDLNEETQSDSLLVLPVGSQRLVFRNFSHSLNKSEIDSIFALINKIHSPKSMIEKTLEKTKQEGMISRWISHLVLVNSTAISKLVICKSFVETLDSKLDISRLGHMAVKLLKILTNSTNVYLVVKDEHELVMFKDDRLFIDLEDEINDLFDQSSAVKSVLRFAFDGVQDGAVVVPIIHNEHIGMISLSGKLDDTNRNLCSFTSKDEKVVLEFAKAFSQAVYEYPSPQDSTLINFSQYLYSLAVRYSPKDVTNTVIKASSMIFDCEKVNFYYYSNNKIRLFSQNKEVQASEAVTFQVQGILESAATSKTAKFLNQSSNQDTFYQEIEKLTGCKTNSLLVIPLKNTSGEIFALVECVNKISSFFDEKDLETAKEVSKVYERVLENWEVSKKNIKEMYRLKGISSSLALIVMVFSKKGRLTYLNQRIDHIFGIQEQEMSESHYSDWLNTNKELKDDIDSVFTNPSVSIRRTSQQIRPGRSKKYLQPIVGNNARSKNLFNYRVVPLRTVSSGVVLILEDCSALEALHKGFRDVQDQIRAITSPVAAETGLQKCIRELNFIVDQVQGSDIKDKINEVLETLKTGSLKKPKFTLEDADMEEFETVNSIFYMESQEFLDIPAELEPGRSSLPDQSLLVTLTELRDWNLNAFKIENKFGYILTMLTDFNAIDQFNINTAVLFTFIKKIQLECDKRNNPFHNFTHCFSVMHSAYMLISSTIALNFFSAINIFSVLTAAVCHDVDHTGRTNMFEINSKSGLAILYNDKSVLEQHHAAVAFSILNEPDSNFLSRVPRESLREIRKTMITAIMGTDMAKHYSILTNVNSRVKDAGNEIGSLPKDSEKMAQFILHAADLAHPTKDYSVYEMWSMLVCQEFSDQNKEEVERHLPITEFMKDLQNPKVYYANEIGFLNFVVRPLWECAHGLLKSNIALLVENLERNIETMKLKLEEWKRVES
jgi:cAMP-specific phosphodiesterase 4